MSDDTLIFWNAYKAVFRGDNTKKLLCSWHVGQTVGRRANELIKVGILLPFTENYTLQDLCIRKLALRLFKKLMRITNKKTFCEEYDKYLTWLAEQKELRFLEVNLGTQFGTEF